MSRENASTDAQTTPTTASADLTNAEAVRLLQGADSGVRPQSGRLAYRFVKRTFDIVFSAGVCVVLFIPGAILAGAICIDSPGGPMFRQVRIGKGGKEIRIWKFRSMYVDAHGHPERYLSEEQLAQWQREQKVDDDPRVTRVGRFIRKTSLDEIPQFINVLVGDMSIIGPRPVTLAETYEFGENRDEALSVRPGITGWWQVTDRNDATWENGRRQERELEYVRNRGFAMDARCFFSTFGVMFGKDRSGR
ncbi:sugar transferase [Paratractidigestivibacter sp.]|uniref:sugar transferase n=1 Tax=Paratractidigestivibacter sp. TaxID=2847316 RepID=UPI002AC9BAB3|nr:sugar transferase [Paratractidigestivibacter sp.]